MRPGSAIRSRRSLPKKRAINRVSANGRNRGWRDYHFRTLIGGIKLTFMSQDIHVEETRWRRVRASGASVRWPRASQSIFCSAVVGALAAQPSLETKVRNDVSRAADESFRWHRRSTPADLSSKYVRARQAFPSLALERTQVGVAAAVRPLRPS